MDFKYKDFLRAGQIIMINPVLKEPFNVRRKYYYTLQKLINCMPDIDLEVCRQELAFYKSVLLGPQRRIKYKVGTTFFNDYYLLLAFDLFAILGFQVTKDYQRLFLDKLCLISRIPKKLKTYLVKIANIAFRESDDWSSIFDDRDNCFARKYYNYLIKIKDIYDYNKKEDTKLVFTATMSAGKSTLINAIVGKNVCKVQNMACTSKIHQVSSKAFEDNVYGKYDGELQVNATEEEIRNNSPLNISNEIFVSTYFDCLFKDYRVSIYDTPGANYNLDNSHSEICMEALSDIDYDLLIYVINVTQMMTEDEEEHLLNLLKLYKQKRIVFVLNKIDQLDDEDDDLFEIIKNLGEYLIKRGFNNPLIFPISSRIAYLYKKGIKNKLSKVEMRELDNYLYKFSESCLEKYYSSIKILGGNIDVKNNLYYFSGIGYLEFYIQSISKQFINK